MAEDIAPSRWASFGQGRHLHELSATELCWCGQSHADVVLIHDTRQPGEAVVSSLLDEQCIDVRPATVAPHPQADACATGLPPERFCNGCGLSEFHLAFAGPMLERGLCRGCTYLEDQRTLTAPAVARAALPLLNQIDRWHARGLFTAWIAALVLSAAAGAHSALIWGPTIAVICLITIVLSGKLMRSGRPR